jgi:hypothetical protein
MFDTAAEIRRCADELIAALSDLPDATGDAWTQENFRRLDAFARLKNPTLTSYYRKHFEKTEFLWDFIAAAPEVGIFLAAESEQAVADESQVTALKHDFEKLLYVYSPIRILITRPVIGTMRGSLPRHLLHMLMAAAWRSILARSSSCTSGCGTVPAILATYGRAGVNQANRRWRLFTLRFLLSAP